MDNIWEAGRSVDMAPPSRVGKTRPASARGRAPSLFQTRCSQAEQPYASTLRAYATELPRETPFVTNRTKTCSGRPAALRSSGNPNDAPSTEFQCRPINPVFSLSCSPSLALFSSKKHIKSVQHLAVPEQLCHRPHRTHPVLTQVKVPQCLALPQHSQHSHQPTCSLRFNVVAAQVKMR
eukprot:2577450-Rhodomonas_salina.4